MSDRHLRVPQPPPEIASVPSDSDPRQVARQEKGLWFSAAAVSLWLCALFVGWTLGGAVHALLIVPLWFRPWRLP